MNPGPLGIRTGGHEAIPAATRAQSAPLRTYSAVSTAWGDANSSPGRSRQMRVHDTDWRLSIVIILIIAPALCAPDLPVLAGFDGS